MASMATTVKTTSKPCSLEQEFLKLGLSVSQSKAFAANVGLVLNSAIPRSHKWREISKTLLSPKVDFAVHRFLFETVYGDSKEPHYIWIPDEALAKETNIYKFMVENGHKSLEALIRWADGSREEFWRIVTRKLGVVFSKRSDDSETKEPVFDLATNGITSPIYFPGAELNAVDTILKGEDDSRTAIVWAAEGELNSNGRPKLHRISLRVLRQSVNQIAHALVHRLKLTKGTAIGIDMPMNWECVAIYLAIIKAGMVVVSIADSFSAPEIAVRMRIAKAKVMFTQDVIVRGSKRIPLYSRVTAAMPSADSTIVVVAADTSDRHSLCVELRANDCALASLILDAPLVFSSVPCQSMAVANVLFSSGTTGEPKAIPWLHSTFVKPLADGYFHQDIRANETVAWPTNVGWMMGPWLIAQLGLGATVALFVGSPLAEGFCKFVEDSGVCMLGVIPSLVRVWKATSATLDADWCKVRRLSSTGEASNAELYHWLMAEASYAPVLEYVGGTEIGGGYLCGSLLQPQLLSAFSCPCLGLNVAVLDDLGRAVCRGNEGELFVTAPSLGLSTTLLNADHYKVYFEGTAAVRIGDDSLLEDACSPLALRRHGDVLRVLSNGYWQHLGRVDDTMNLSGIKVSSVDIERVAVGHWALSRQCAAIAHRAHEVGADHLVICAVPSQRYTCFELRFEAAIYGLDVAPPLNATVQRTLVAAVREEASEECKARSGDLRQCAVYRVNDAVVWQRPFEETLAILRGASAPVTVTFLHKDFGVEQVRDELRVMLKKHINPLFRVRDLLLRSALPRTASGKVMRRILRRDYAAIQQ